MKKISRRNFLKTCAIAGSAAALTACGGSSSTTSGSAGNTSGSASSGPQTITFYPRDANVSSGLVGGFKGEYFASRGFNLDIWAYSDEKTNAILASGDLPDVMFIPEQSLDIMVQGGMLLNLDGTVTMQCGETEIGQGADTAYAQMTAEAVGLKSYKDVRVVSCQDTDVTPTGLGAYASRQTYTAGFSIRQTATLLRQKILAYATKLTRQAVDNMDIVEGNIVRKQDGAVLLSLSELAMTAQYNAADSEHITAESTYTIRNNAYSFGCTFADVEVDIALCKVKVNNIINVHDCGSLINPALAAAQVHGGMSMAIGFGLSEQLLFDEKTGKPLNNNLLDYKLSTFMDHPHLEAQFVENAEPTSPFGTKALGEPPACSGAPAIRNAIYNATGVAVDTIPITPHVLFAEFTKAGLIHDSWNEKEGK